MVYDERISFKKATLNHAFGLKKESNIDLSSKVENSHERLINQTKWWGKGESRNFRLSVILANNNDLHPSIFKLFYFAAYFNTIAFVFAVLANAIYFFNFFAFILGSDIFASDEMRTLWPWEGLLITNLLWLFFLIHVISDYYKISLRGTYRNQILKLFFLDFLTFNFLSVIGIYIFARNRALMLRVLGDDELKFESLDNQQAIKKYAWVIFKVELIILIINLAIFLTFFLLGYFIENTLVKNFCSFIMCILFVFFMLWVSLNFTWALIAKKMLLNLAKTNSTHYFLTTVRFLAFFNSYYIAIFLNFLNLDNFDQEYILKNW